MTQKQKVTPTARTVETVESAIVELREKRAAAAAELARLQAGRPMLLLDLTDAGEAKIEALDAATVKANRTIERADAAVAAHTEEMVAIRKVAEEGRRQALYERGLAAAEEYQRLRTVEYPRLAAELADVLRRMGPLVSVCEKALRNLPAGGDHRAMNVEPSSYPTRLEARLPGFWEPQRFGTS